MRAGAPMVFRTATRTRRSTDTQAEAARRPASARTTEPQALPPVAAALAAALVRVSAVEQVQAARTALPAAARRASPSGSRGAVARALVAAAPFGQPSWSGACLFARGRTSAAGASGAGRRRSLCRVPAPNSPARPRRAAAAVVRRRARAAARREQRVQPRQARRARRSARAPGSLSVTPVLLPQPPPNPVALIDRVDTAPVGWRQCPGVCAADS